MKRMTPEEKLKRIERIINVNYAAAFEMGIPLPEPISDILGVIQSSDGSKQFTTYRCSFVGTPRCDNYCKGECLDIRNVFNCRYREPMPAKETKNDL